MTDAIKTKIEQIARLRVGGLTLTAIAANLGMSIDGIARITALDYYKQAYEKVSQEQITRLDKQLQDKADILTKHFNEGIPQAVATLYEAVKQKRDMRVALEAAKEFLDRDPERRFVKTSRAAQQQAEAGKLPEQVLVSIAAEGDAVAVATPVVLVPPDRHVN